MSNLRNRLLKNRVQRFSVLNNYKITVFSGTKAVKTYKVINDRLYPEPDINGWSFYVNDKVVYVSGTVVIEEV